MVVLGILAILNPSKDDYGNYCNKLIKENNPSSQLTPEIRNVSSAIMVNNTERTNYYVFSIYKTEVLGYKLVKYGYLGSFFEENSTETILYVAIPIVFIIFLIIGKYYFQVPLDESLRSWFNITPYSLRQKSTSISNIFDERLIGSWSYITPGSLWHQYVFYPTVVTKIM